MAGYLEAAGVGAVTVALIIGAAMKVVHSTPLRLVLAAIGVPSRGARAIAPVVPGIETGAAVLFAVFPSSVFSQILIASLFALFAGAGLVGMMQRRRIPCACFGALRAHATLGRMQVFQFVAVLGLIGALRLIPSGWNASNGLRGLGVCLLVASAIVLVGASRDWRRTKTDRVSLAETRRLARRLALETEPGG